MSAAGLNWVYYGVGAILGLGAAVLAYWALLRDRSRGRRRCPGCWYDMGGTPGMRCPECGRAAASEKKFHKTRRRWRVGVLAFLIGLLGYATGSVPRYEDGGWPALVPSSVLVWIAPPYSESSQWSVIGPPGGFVVSQSGTFVRGATFTPPAVSAGQRLTNETWRRIRSGALARWQSQEFFRRFLAAMGEDFGKDLHLPVKWPVDEWIPGQLQPRNIGGCYLVAGDPGKPGVFGPRIVLRPQSEEVDSVTVEFALWSARRVAYRTKQKIPILIEGTRENLLERIDSEESNQLVRTAIAPCLAASKNGMVVILRDRSDSPKWRAIDFAVAYSFDVRDGDAVLGTGTAAPQWTRPVWKDWDEAEVAWNPGGRDALARPGAHITLRVHGEPGANLQSYLEWPFDKPRAGYWGGSFTMELEMKAHPGQLKEH